MRSRTGAWPPPLRCATSQNPPDSNVPYAWPELAADGALRLACVGRLDPPAKGQDILLEALAGPSWAARPWRLYLYGDGPMWDGLERLVRHLGLADRVIFAGHARVEEIWSLCHVLVMPSRHEGLPLAIIEAMLCGRPVVATDVASNTEVVDDDVTGFVADAPTVASIAEALERLWARRRDAKMIGKAGSKRIRQLLPSDPVRVFADKLANMYFSTASGSCRRGLEKQNSLHEA
jgi:glycosyltransferase involved in cell wall biosynthesis